MKLHVKFGSHVLSLKKGIFEFSLLNSLPHMPTLGSSNAAENKDMMSKILTNWNTILKTLWEKKNCSLRAISSFP